MLFLCCFELKYTLVAKRTIPIIDRSTVNAFDVPEVAQAITAAGRKKLIFAGNRFPRSRTGGAR